MTASVRRALPLVTLGAIVALGLGLRIAGAAGGLWVDEAWSAILVERARTPLGVFLSINHDNNHHLNSLWMQAVGVGAPPMLLRALSIATGTASILVAGAIGARRSVAQGLVAALLFAVSPILVTYGSEARGYAPMLLAALLSIWLVARWLDTRPSPPGRTTAWALGALAVIGLLSQLTMVFFIVAIAAWAGLTLARRGSIDAAITGTVRLMLPSVGATILVFALVFGAAAASATGMQVGDYVPFSLDRLQTALTTMVATTLGLPMDASWPVFGVATLAIVAIVYGIRKNSPLAAFHGAAILGLPIAFVALRIGNAEHARYFLLSATALILLASDLLARGLAQHGLKRAVAAILLAGLTIACLQADRVQIRLRRGDTGAAIAAMMARAPGGATVHVDALRPVAVLQIGAAEARYPLRVTGDCAPARFAYIDAKGTAPGALTLQRCGHTFTRIAARDGAALSGLGWSLYGWEGRQISVH